MRGFDARLRKLEDRLSELEAADLCASCGSPDPHGRVVLLIEDDPPPPRCPSCDAQLDHDGRPLGPDPVTVVLSGLEFEAEGPEPPGEEVQPAI